MNSASGCFGRVFSKTQAARIVAAASLVLTLCKRASPVVENAAARHPLTSGPAILSRTSLLRRVSLADCSSIDRILFIEAILSGKERKRDGILRYLKAKAPVIPPPLA
jgi:hypothetical protein